MGCVSRRRLSLGVRVSVGMDALPLWHVVVFRRLRLGMGARCGMRRIGLGILWRWAVREYWCGASRLQADSCSLWPHRTPPDTSRSAGSHLSPHRPVAACPIWSAPGRREDGGGNHTGWQQRELRRGRQFVPAPRLSCGRHVSRAGSRTCQHQPNGSPYDGGITPRWRTADDANSVDEDVSGGGSAPLHRDSCLQRTVPPGAGPFSDIFTPGAEANPADGARPALYASASPRACALASDVFSAAGVAANVLATAATASAASLASDVLSASCSGEFVSA